MKTLTELSGTLIRMAAAAVAEAKRSLPAEEKPVTQAPETPSAAPEEPGEETQAVAESAAAAEAPAGEAAEPAAPAAPTEAEPGLGSDAIHAVLEEAIAKATGLSGDRLSMLRAAVEAVGRRASDVRLVRVFGAEEKISGATAIGDHQYVVDFLPQSMKQVPGGPKDDRGGRRGGRGGGRGGGGGGRGGGGGAKAGATGGFSMDSLREDRKNERGGRGRPGGGGRRPGGGGAPGSRGPGGRPGGDPKK